MRAKWYSPQLPRETVRRLYFKAKAEGIPMTVLANRLVEEALGQTESTATFTAEQASPEQSKG